MKKSELKQVVGKLISEITASEKSTKMANLDDQISKLQLQIANLQKQKEALSKQQTMSEDKINESLSIEEEAYDDGLVNGYIQGYNDCKSGKQPLYTEKITSSEGKFYIPENSMSTGVGENYASKKVFKKKK